MFRKLLKYEWKANAKLFWILSAAALGVAVLGGIVLRVALHIGANSDSNVTTALVLPGMLLLVGFCALAVVGYAAAVEIINLVRFYKNKFTDEGYLTFTLPVTARDLYLSSFVNILLWMAISLVVVVICYVVGLWIGVGELAVILGEDATFQYLMKSIVEMFQTLQDEMASIPGYGLYQVLGIISSVLSPVYAITVMLTCLTMGSVQLLWPLAGLALEAQDFGGYRPLLCSFHGHQHCDIHLVRRAESDHDRSAGSVHQCQYCDCGTADHDGGCNRGWLLSVYPFDEE